MQIKYSARLLFFSILISFIPGADSQAQVTLHNPIDVAAGLQDSTFTAMVTPIFTKGTVEQVFDGTHLTEAGVSTSDSLVLTLEFNESLSLSDSKVFFWNAGNWSLETADSYDALTQRTGTYRKLVNNDPFLFFQWDSTHFELTPATIVRLTARNPQANGIFLGEWVLYTSTAISHLQILPDPVLLVPETSLSLAVKMVDFDGNAFPYTSTEYVNWSSDDRTIATVDEFGKITAYSLGKTTIHASTSKLSGSASVDVVNDFEAQNAPTLTIKVALVLQNPVIDSVRMRRINEVRGWDDPHELVSQILEDFAYSTDGVVKFQIVETHDDEGIFSRFDGELMTIDTLAYFYSTPARLNEMKRLAEIEGRVRFDYNAMIDYYDFVSKRNNGEIDEVWVYAYPFAGMYESQLVGPGAFWWNSPPLAHPGLENLLSVMGWNYERGVAEALHSFGHRAESAIWHVYGRWDLHSQYPNAWEIFTRIEREIAGKAHIGNIHFPPNGMSDYDYSNRTYVTTYADNWKR
ncbi:Ig-like domain-containing protein [candidate division KSB1 bacterium]|nr:Ig-like domain-containing protein [candidate division KSB1 bacterium]